MANGTEQNRNDPSNPDASDGEGLQGQEGNANPQDQSGETQGGQGSEGAEGGSQTPFEFSDPDLAGKDPKAVEELYQATKAAVQSQGAQLTEYDRRLKELEDRSDQPPAEEPGFDESEFWDNPMEATREVVRREVSSALNEAIAPFKEDLAKQTASDVIQQGQQNLENFGFYRPYIEQMLQSRGKSLTDITDFPTLRSLYFTVVGYLTQRGVTPDQNQGQPMNQNQPTNQGNQSPSTPPQHRPSSAPLPANRGGQGGQDQPRELTEEEKTLARQRGMSHDEFRRWQDMSPDEVITAPRHSEEA